MVCGIALGILGDFAASEDAAQDAFVTAWQKFRELREPESLRAWLAQIARNAAHGHRRRRRDQAGLDQAADFADPSPTPDAAAASADEIALVRDALAKLPETYRLPLVLYYREGQSVRTVAESLAISEDAVKQRLARGREILREQISGLIETVLTRTGPTPIFTTAVAAAIGAIASPAAMAASALAANATTSTATTSSISFWTAMNTSKTFLATTALVAVVCVPLGYRFGTPRPMPAATTANSTAEPAASPLRAAPSFESSALFAEWRALHERHGTNAAAMPALYRAIAELADPFRRRTFRTALIAEWAQVDAPGGLKFFLGKGPDASQREQFLSEWLALDARAAIDALLNAGPGWSELAHESLPEIARRAPDRVAEVVSRMSPPDYWETKIRDAFTILAERDLIFARRAAESVTGPNREQALVGVAPVWAKRDFDAAVAWAKGLPDGINRDEIIRGALIGRAAVDPIGALERVGMVPAGGRHAHMNSTTGARVLEAAAKADFDATVTWLATHPGRFGRDELHGLSAAVTDRLNADAAKFLSACAEANSLTALMPAIESALLNQAAGQRAAVWEWLKSQPETAPLKSLRQKVPQFAGFHDTELAMRLVDDLPRTADGDAQVREVARSMYNGELHLWRFDALLKKAPDRLRQPLIDIAFDMLKASIHSLNRYSIDDPQSWIARLELLPEPQRASGTESIAGAWAKQTPEEAIEWATSLPATSARPGVLAAIASGWAAQDAHRAAEWVAAMPAGAERDRSAGSLVAVIAERFPQEAWQWALNIDDAQEQRRAAEVAAKAMAARDPATARQKIESGPFTAETKTALRSAIDLAARQNPPASSNGSP